MDDSLTLSERYYVKRARVNWLASMVALISIVIGGPLAIGGNTGTGIAFIAGCVILFAALIGGMEWNFGLLSPNRRYGVTDSRGVRHRKRYALDVKASGDQVIVTKHQRTSDANILWPIFGSPPEATAVTRYFDATTDEGQSAAHEFVAATKVELEEAAMPYVSVEAKTLAKALKP